jgi:DNA-binding response OmpR family regulator
MKSVRVLIVEDNPLVMDLIKRGLEPHCELDTAADGADALLKVIDDPPDMIISDYKMPGLDGRQLYEKLRGRDRTKGLPFIFMAGRADIEEKLRPLVDGVEDFIVKPFFMKEFVRRAKKVVDRLQLEKLQQRSARPGTIQGRLEEMSIMDLLQSLEMGQKSCRLTIEHAGAKCEMFFAGGACKHAQLGGIEGNEAVFKAVSWSAGEFEIDFTASSEKTTCTMSTQGLLMEAVRLIDEASRDSADAQG